MIDIKCDVVNKVYRGQDFLKHYCSVCQNLNLATITQETIICPHLRYYQSYKPKRRKPWEQDQIGKQATIPRGGF